MFARRSDWRGGAGTGGRGRGGFGRGRGRGATSTQKGLFADGVWLCNCSPRLPANSFEVKKDTPNKGKWFYTCQKPEPKHADPKSSEIRCDFFLWFDDAKSREAGAVLSNSRSEPQPKPNHTPSKNVPPPPTVEDETSTKQADGGFIRRDKRSRVEFEKEDEFGGDTLDAEQIDLMSEAAETPSKSRKTDGLAPPSRRRLPWATDTTTGGLPTPQTARTTKHIFTTPSHTTGPDSVETPATRDNVSYPKLPSSSVRDTSLSPTRPRHLDDTPTPIRFVNHDTSPLTAPDLASEVFELFKAKNVSLEPGVREDLKQLLNKHSRRTRGIANGREITQLELKARDAKVAELQHRIAALEADFEAERAQNRYRDWEKHANGQP